MKLSFVIPVYNEQESVAKLTAEIQEIQKKLTLPWEIIFVDDGSSDNSLSVLRKLAQNVPELKVISFRRNYGQTAALAAGIKQASGDAIITLDADLQNDPADTETLIQKLEEGYDVVSGWRKNRKDAFVSRVLPSWIANKCISVVSGVRLHDYGCTLKAYRREVISSVNLYGEMHRFIPIYARYFGAKITEVVVNHRARQFGKSKYTLMRTFRVILDLLTVKFLNDYATKPMYFFGGFGLMSFACAFITLVIAFILRWSGVATLIQTPLPLLSVFFLVVGFQLILMGLLAEMIMRNYYEGQDKNIYNIKEKINF